MEGKASAPLAAGRGNTAWMFYWQKQELTPAQTQGVERDSLGESEVGV